MQEQSPAAKFYLGRNKRTNQNALNDEILKATRGGFPGNGWYVTSDAMVGNIYLYPPSLDESALKQRETFDGFALYATPFWFDDRGNNCNEQYEMHWLGIGFDGASSDASWIGGYFYVHWQGIVESDAQLWIDAVKRFFANWDRFNTFRQLKGGEQR